MTLRDWAARWCVPDDALRELAIGLTRGAQHDATTSEAAVTAQVRLEAARLGMHLFRNNVGATKTDTGSFVRFGLANDSAGLNARLKSADLIGFDAGGRFLSVECKAPGWRYTGTERERVQLAWATLVNGSGGRAIFATGPGALVD